MVNFHSPIGNSKMFSMQIMVSNVLSLPGEGEVRSSSVNASVVLGCGAVLHSGEEGSAVHHIGPVIIVG